MEYTRRLSDKVKQTNGIGLALGGGMARGFSHIGVLKTLDKYGIKPTIVAGTSIGALVGGCYLAGKMPELEEWARALNRFKILSYLDLRVRSAGLIGGKKLASLLEQHFGDMLIEDLPYPFSAVAADLATGHEVWLQHGLLTESIRASFALPGVFLDPEVSRTWLMLACAGASVVGHCYPVWFGFAGGKGAATAIGALLGIAPSLALPGVLVWVIVLVTTGFVGLATMLTAVALPIWLLISGLDGRLPLLVFLTGLALFIVFTHRANIRRLRAGNENRIERAMLLRRRPR